MPYSNQQTTNLEKLNPVSKKAESAYRTISEVASSLNLPAHVLRFWESKFSQISPLKRGGGRRYYRPEDVEIIERIQDLLHNQGYTIKGVQQLLSKEAKSGRQTGKPALTVMPTLVSNVGPNAADEAQKNALTAAQLAKITNALRDAKQALQESRQQVS